jgi:hypothetical protein
MGKRGPQNHLLRLHAPTWWIAALCAVTISVQAATITVTNTNDGGPGSLRQALVIANDGDTIAFAVAGTIVLTSGELLVNKSITISGPGAVDVVVNGNASSRVFHVAPGRTVVITGLVVTNGVASGNPPEDYGGGIYNDHAALTLDNCTISSNLAGFGGGIYNDGFQGTATLAISNTTIYHNTATYRGGAIYNDGYSSGYASLTISTSTLSSNSARAGATIYNDGEDFGTAMLTADDAIFRGNSAVFGGCIYNNSYVGNASLTLNDSALSGNSANDTGGCIYNYMVFGYGTQTLNNSSFSNNSAGSGGGAIYNDHGLYFTINYCAISGNSAQNWGGGIYNDGSQSGAAWMTINCSTLNGNSGATGGGIFNDGAQRGDTHLKVTNSTISENMASYGGGLANNGSDGFYVNVQISSTTFNSNSATEVGGNIYNVGQTGQDTVIVTLTNTILKSGPLGGNIFDDSHTVLSLGYNLSNDACGGFLKGPGDQTDTDPMLGPLHNNGGPTLTYALLPGSSAINAGDPNFTPPPSYDQRGPDFDRVVNGRIDIGSFEVQEPAPAAMLGRNFILRPRSTLPAR